MPRPASRALEATPAVITRPRALKGLAGGVPATRWPRLSPAAFFVIIFRPSRLRCAGLLMVSPLLCRPGGRRARLLSKGATAPELRAGRVPAIPRPVVSHARECVFKSVLGRAFRVPSKSLVDIIYIIDLENIVLARR
ncbi:hypothetical protein GCM10009828_101120 [Actinoplanes couchii]|uniref:Uncharacterized protein n=1 Tax=Actinoplanes couchii TaxID=403638 RepID=A0ABQ3XLT6_9ACTN|nr:hypothetical protein Aco03nite_078770 [Actinoplanes couchii]